MIFMRKPVIERPDRPMIRVSSEKLVGLPYEYMLRKCDRKNVRTVLHRLNPSFRTYLEGTAVRNLIDSYPETFNYDEVEIVAVGTDPFLDNQVLDLMTLIKQERPLKIPRVKGKRKVDFMVERVKSKGRGEKFALVPAQSFWRRLFRAEEQSPVVVDFWDDEDFKEIDRIDF